MVVVVVVVVVVRKPTPNYLRQASQNLGKYVLSYTTFFSSEVHHLGRAVHAVTNPVVEHVNMNRLLAHGLKLLGRFCQPDVLSYTTFFFLQKFTIWAARSTLSPTPLWSM